MAEAWIVLLSVELLYRFTSGAEPLSRNCCQGDYLPLFQNITFFNGTKAHLFISDVRTTLIGTWESIHVYSIFSGYEDKLFLDKNGTILMKNIQRSDEAKYVISYASNTKSALQINVMVAPTKHCKPMIKKMDNILMASLENEDCGRPVANVHWMDHPHISIVSQRVAKLAHGKEVGTYYACAQTQALSCVKNLQMSDYCTSFTIEGQVQSQETDLQIGTDQDKCPSSEMLGMEIGVCATSAFCSIITVAVVLITFLMQRKDRRKMGTETGVIAEMTSLLQTMESKEYILNGRSNFYQDEIKSPLASRRHGIPEFLQYLQHNTDRRNCIMPYRTQNTEYQTDSGTE